MNGDLSRRIMALSLKAKARLLWRMSRDPHVPVRAKAVLGVIGLYLLMPFDLVPDFIPVLGQLDDLLIIGVGLAAFVSLTPRRVVEQHLGTLE